MSRGVTLETRVVGDAEVRARLIGFAPALRSRVRTVLIRLGVEARDLASALAPRSKGRRSASSQKYGQLYKSMGVTFVETVDEMSVRVGPPAFYGRFLEFGVNETTVHITKRRVKSRDVRGVKGLGVRRVTLRNGDNEMRGYVRRGLLKRGNVAKPFDKRVRVPPHPFMGPALASMRDRVLAGLGAAVTETVEG